MPLLALLGDNCTYEGACREILHHDMDALFHKTDPVMCSQRKRTDTMDVQQFSL